MAGMAVTNLYGINILEEVEKYCRQQKEYEEQTLAEIIQKYDFVVGSKECKHSLMKVLPEGANIICTPYIDSPTTIYAIKKFDARDYIVDPQESEMHPDCKECEWKDPSQAQCYDGHIQRIGCKNINRKQEKEL
jgi:hypothetical protein